MMRVIRTDVHKVINRRSRRLPLQRLRRVRLILRSRTDIMRAVLSNRIYLLLLLIDRQSLHWMVLPLI